MRMTILLGGETVYDHDIEGWLTPPPQEQLPQSIQAQLDPTVKPAPWYKALLVAMIGRAAAQGLQDQRLQPLEVDLQLRATGWTLVVELPAPEQDTDAIQGHH